MALAGDHDPEDVACIMLATWDMLEGMVFNTEALHWLCDLCTDTDFVSRDFATKEKLDINITVRIRIGTARGASFLTDGVAMVKLPIINIKGSKHILEIRAHVADIGKKCLVHTAGLARQGYIFVHGGDNKGADSTFMMSPSVWRNGQECHTTLACCILHQCHCAIAISTHRHAYLPLVRRLLHNVLVEVFADLVLVLDALDVQTPSRHVEHE